MGFYSPVTVQNVVATTSELLPTMSAILKSPWQGFTRRAAGVAKQRQAAQASEARRIEPQPSFVLPKSLESIPISALRQTYSPQALASTPTVARSMAAVPRNTLRLFNPLTRSMPLNTFIARQYSTASRHSPFSNLRPIPRPSNVGLALTQSRSLFGGPSQNQLARYEQAANKNPNSAAAQYTFYQALLKANLPHIIVNRHQSGNFASNSMVEQVYHTALQKTGQGDVAGQMNGTHGLSPQQLQAVGQAVSAHGGGSAITKLRAGSGFKTDPLYVVVEEPLSKTIGSWIKWIVGFALLAYFALVVITLLVESTGVLKKVGGGGSAEVRPEHQTTRFSDVQGCDEAKEELTDIVDFLKNPDRYNKLGGRLPKGVLLIGPPGTGKTLLARAVAGEAGVPFFYMSGSEFDEVYVGVGAKRVRELFATARAKAPAIVFIDELDAVGGKRQSRDANYHRQTLNQLLNDLDGFDQTSGVIFIAATNHPEILDKALLRPGRFDRHVQVELPDVRGRLAILKHHTKKIRLAPDADLSKIARGTPGFSGAELENLANSAAIQASKNQAKNVSHLDLEWAKDKIMMGSERRTRVVPLADKLQTAYHEGGHTLVGLYRKGYSEVHKATILPRGQAAGITYFLPVEEHHRSRAQYIRHLEVCMGGKMAEEIVFGNENVGDGVSGDIQQATQLAYMMVTQFGFSDLLGNVDFRSNYDQVSPETKRLIDNEVRRLIDEAKESAKKLLLEKRSELDALAKGLVQYETLDRDEIMKVIKGEKLPDRLEAMPNTPIKIPEVPMPPHVPPPIGGSGNGGVGAIKEDK